MVKVSLVVEPGLIQELRVVLIGLWLGRPLIELRDKRSGAQFGEVHEKHSTGIGRHYFQQITAAGGTVCGVPLIGIKSPRSSKNQAGAQGHPFALVHFIGTTCVSPSAIFPCGVLSQHQNRMWKRLQIVRILHCR